MHDACSRAIHELMGVNGGRTMNADAAMQRHFRDMLAMRNHPAANIEMSSGLYAQAMLGVPPPPFDPSQRIFLETRPPVCTAIAAREAVGAARQLRSSLA